MFAPIIFGFGANNIVHFITKATQNHKVSFSTLRWMLLRDVQMPSYLKAITGATLSSKYKLWRQYTSPSVLASELPEEYCLHSDRKLTVI